MRSLVPSSLLAIALALAVALAGPARADVPYPPAPDWLSAENDLYGTGCDFGDIDGDGWPDLAVSNGNDIVEAPNLVYLNEFGALPVAAGWVSDDARYSGHCELADLDSDGYPELMVTTYITSNWGLGSVQVYRNLGGTLETTPSWVSPATFNSFRAGFGDPDGDGDLDLAVATGEAYNGRYQANLIFFNEGGQLATTPGWTSADEDAAYDIEFVDVDRDGDQDLAVLTSGDPAKIYFNEDGVLQTTPGWTSSRLDNGNTFDFDDLDGDGDPDLVVAYNSQLGGSGRTVIYWNDGGTLRTEPDWEADFVGYGSAVVACDVDADGLTDLVGGSWWGPVRIYLNRGAGVFPTVPDYVSAAIYESVVENLAFADLDRADEQPRTATFAAVDGPAFRLPHRHLQHIAAVRVGGETLPDSLWCGHARDGWVSVVAAALTGEVAVDYAVSRERDLAVSNWDDATFVFLHQGVTGIHERGRVPGPIASCAAYPNPFNPQTTFVFELGATASVRLGVYDVAGRRVADLFDGVLASGRHEVAWRPRSLASGVYLYRLEAGGAQTAGRVLLVK